MHAFHVMICSSWQVGGDALTDLTCAVNGLAAGYTYYARVTATATQADGSSLPPCSSLDSDVVTTLTAAEDALLEKEAALALARSVAEEKARLEQEALLALQRAEESERQLAALQSATAAQVAATRAEVDQARASLVCGLAACVSRVLANTDLVMCLHCQAQASKLEISQLKAKAQQVCNTCCM